MTCPKLSGNRCQCPSCGLFFSSPREFDRHRIGTYAPTGQLGHKRRCLRPDEMAALGWRTSKMGFRMQPRLGRAPAALEAPASPTPATPVLDVGNEASQSN